MEKEERDDTGNGKRRTEEKTEKRAGGGLKWFTVLLAAAAVLAAGAAAAFLVSYLNGAPFGWYLWPVAACVVLFLFSTAGFFLTGGKAELVYGACSIGSVVCLIVQLAILF